MEATVKMTVFWVFATYSVAEVHRSYRGTCCLNRQGRHYTAASRIRFKIEFRYAMTCNVVVHWCSVQKNDNVLSDFCVKRVGKLLKFMETFTDNSV
jgi:hypothetical protein